jgi:hypothetical protein
MLGLLGLHFADDKVVHRDADDLVSLFCLYGDDRRPQGKDRSKGISL